MDYNGDGRLDFLTGSISGKVYLYQRKPNGTFGAPVVLQREVRGFIGTGHAPLNVGAPSTVAMADWFGNGKLDLFIGNGDGSVYLVPNVGTRRKPVFRQPVRLKAANQYIHADGGQAGPSVADWDRDGKLDLIVGCQSGRVVWYRNIGTRTKPELAAGVTLVKPFTENLNSHPEDFQHPTRSGRYAKVCVADWNGDGLPDLVVGDYSVGRVGNSYHTHGWVWVYLRSGGSLATRK